MKLQQFKDQIWKIVNQTSPTQSQIEEQIDLILAGKGIPNYDFLNTFVVRCTLNKDNKVIKNISQCSYPPDSIMSNISIQRANYPGQQVFYCSYPFVAQNAGVESTCIAETAWEHIEDLNRKFTFATLTKWRTKRPLKLWLAAFSQECMRQNEDYNNVCKKFETLIKNNPKPDLEVIETLEYFSDLLGTKEGKNKVYLITAAFYNVLLKLESRGLYSSDGLIYPSANTFEAGLNIALKRQLIDDGTLRCALATIYVIEREDQNPKNLRIYHITQSALPDSRGNLTFELLPKYQDFKGILLGIA